MRITKEQEAVLDKIRCVRVKDANSALLGGIIGPVIDDKGNRSPLIDLFRSKKHVDDDKNNDIASFLILSPDDTVLLYFSLRCGELFENIDAARAIKSSEAYNAVVFLQKNQNAPLEEKNRAYAAIQNALNCGLSFDDFEPIQYKKKNISASRSLKLNQHSTQVFKSYPAVELKFFGTNDACRDCWRSLGFNENHRVGETLFWSKVADKIMELQNFVGCKYVYLFAADSEPEGSLVQYYRRWLHFESNLNISVNIPEFDHTSQFLFQDISKLKDGKEAFFKDFNPDDIV